VPDTSLPDTSLPAPGPNRSAGRLVTTPSNRPASSQGYTEVQDAIGVFVKAAKAAGLAHTVLAPGASLD